MRTYKRKTTRCSYTTEDLKNAAKVVNDEGKSVNAAAKEFGIKRMTLTRFLKKLNKDGDSSMGYATPRQVFSSTQEDSLKKYLLQMASIFYGYSPKDVRRLAYPKKITLSFVVLSLRLYKLTFIFVNCSSDNDH